MFLFYVLIRWNKFSAFLLYLLIYFKIYVIISNILVKGYDIMKWLLLSGVVISLLLILFSIWITGKFVSFIKYLHIKLKNKKKEG